ncbi:tyrosine-protein kinase Etk/Wzc [Paraburkholderia diazotrophica]|uniref:non-specific protein-tyrosine kinase n=1 Tax=Paraburkholderia diazotrophica TaxID=667676 RepID=A0A1H7C7Y3_9BURK|nr:polysaccharide biosynthesis tyrosine autokinase [Paraburkholderia diazotrophica]SEJ81745.1 tyrosine-protein kinase Etk/Wzc [Paraburkholderia diazotrophica]
MDYYPYNSLPAPPAPVNNERTQLSGREMLNLMRDHIWEILATTAAVFLLALTYQLVASPVYSADVLVRVDPPEPNALGIALQNQDSMLPPPAPSPSTEMGVMQSRSVLDPVIERYRFDVTVKPRTIPVLGDIADKFATPGEPNGAWLGLKSFAWGGEVVKVGYLNVPQNLEEEKLRLVALDGGTYELLGPSGEFLLKGEVGKPATANGVSVLINQLAARPGTHFEVIRWNGVDAVKRFMDVVKITDKVKDSGLIQIEYANKSASMAAEVANALGQQYLTTAAASRQLNDTQTLNFIKGELPRLLADLRKTEQALKDFRAKSNSMQPTAESQTYLQGGLDLDRQIASLQLQRTQLLDKYAPGSRWIQSIDSQLAQLNKTKSEFDNRFQGMPASERESVDLIRAQKVAETIYMGMVQKAEQLTVRRASTTGGAHIVDAAIRPHRPVKPNPLIVLPGGVVLGLVSGIFLVFMRRHVLVGVTDPRYVERRLSVPVVGEVLFSHQQTMLDRSLPAAARKPLPGVSAKNGPPQRNGGEPGAGANDRIDPSFSDSGTKVLAARFPHDPSVEALRAVRTTMSRDLANARNNIVMVTGPTTSAGKSFVAANLATLHAEAGSRVVLIDGDMRRGHLAAFFSQSNRGGLSEVLSDRIPLRDALREVGIDGVTFMSCGARPENPAALLTRPRFRQLLERLGNHFDLVIIDTPPFLAVTDASIIANEAGGSLLVLRSEMQSEEEIADTVKKIERAGGRIAGCVFNGIPVRRSTRSYGYATNYASDVGDVETAS